jgi:hypothetical protein
MCVRTGRAKKKEREDFMCGSKTKEETGVEERRKGDYVSVW